MAYLIGLFIILAMIFSAVSGSNLIGNLKNKITETIFPKSQTEITIENLRDDYQTLGNFFSNSIPTILDSKGTSPETKAAIKKAAAAFNNSKQRVNDLEKLTKNDKNIFKAVVEKVLDLDKEPALEPTSIPPQCHLECLDSK